MLVKCAEYDAAWAPIVRAAVFYPPLPQRAFQRASQTGGRPGEKREQACAHAHRLPGDTRTGAARRQKRRQEGATPMKQKTITATLVALAIVVLLQVSQALSAPSASASSLGPRQEVQQLHQQSGEPALTSLTVTADGTTQPLAPAFSSTVKYYTIVVGTP